MAGKTQAQTDSVVRSDSAANEAPKVAPASTALTLPEWAQQDGYTVATRAYLSEATRNTNAARVEADKQVSDMLADPTKALVFCDRLHYFVRSMRDERHRAACAVIEQIRAHVTGWQSAESDMDRERHKLDVQAQLYLLSRVGPKSVSKGVSPTDYQEMSLVLRSLMLAAQRASAQPITVQTYADVTKEYKDYLAAQKQRADRAAGILPKHVTKGTEQEARTVTASIPETVDAAPAETVASN